MDYTEYPMSVFHSRSTRVTPQYSLKVAGRQVNEQRHHACLINKSLRLLSSRKLARSHCFGCADEFRAILVLLRSCSKGPLPVGFQTQDALGGIVDEYRDNQKQRREMFCTTHERSRPCRRFSSPTLEQSRCSSILYQAGSSRRSFRCSLPGRDAWRQRQRTDSYFL